MTDNDFNPKLTLAAADLAIKHAKKNGKTSKASKADSKSDKNKDFDQDPADQPGKKVQAKSGPNLQNVMGKFVHALMSDGQDVKNPLSFSMFLGMALIVAALLVWPAVGFGVAIAVALAGGAIIAVGNMARS